MRRQFYSILLASCLMLTCGIAQARGHDCVIARNERSVLPSNLILSEDVRQILEKVWRRSPTLRGQCRRIARAPRAKIRLSFVVRTSNQYHALTTTTRYVDGPVAIAVRIFVTGRYAEMIGHELEHVLEQIEGLNLEAQALKESSGVSRNENGFYETKRAVNAGRKVYTEYRDAKMVGNAEAAASPCSAEETYLRKVQNKGGHNESDIHGNHDHLRLSRLRSQRPDLAPRFKKLPPP